MSSDITIDTIDTPRPKYPFIPDVIPTDEPVSVHVVNGDEITVFGSGYASGMAKLLRELEPIGEPDVVVVEHGDPDHFDAVPLFRELFDDITVAVPADDADALTDVGIKADVYLNHNDIVGSSRAIHAPGHTRGNMSFLHEPTGTLFAGDTIVHSTSPNAAPGDWSGAFAPMKPALNADDELARESIGILAEYDIEFVCLTHGPNVDDAAEELEALFDDLELQ